MNINSLSTYARKHVFESARFYYGVLVVLTSYFLLNRFLQKLSYVYLDDRWTMLKTGEGLLFAVAYGFVLISAWHLRRKIPRYVFGCWGGIVLIFLINEFRFAWGNPDYSLIESLTKSQGYYTAKFTMPLLFWGVWGALGGSKNYGNNFLKKLDLFLVFNGVFLVSGAILDVSLFESYPKSNRWGYSGLIWHGAFNGIIYGLFLIFQLSKVEDKDYFKIIVYTCCLLLLGQKSGLLYLGLVVVFFCVKTTLTRLGVFALSVFMVLMAPHWAPRLVSHSVFWNDVFEKVGVWGVMSSTRINLLNNVYNKKIFVENSHVDWLLGGWSRYPNFIEMMLFDITMFFGLGGLLCLFIFYKNFIKNWRASIPLIVAFFAGGLYEAPMAMLIFGIVLFRIK